MFCAYEGHALYAYMQASTRPGLLAIFVHIDDATGRGLRHELTEEGLPVQMLAQVYVAG